ncbi:MAG: hypothetical protein EA403_11810 [Spirochaetaceae bacterium]|nr:MAG: hypothetical protein EA403_11810 [Spirochaetaceae bacterium]
MKLFLRLVLIISALLIAACATAPDSGESIQPLTLDTGFPYRPSPEAVYGELPEPFVRLVDLSRLRVGMTKAEVLAIFPDPRTINVSPRGLEVWEYGFAQLHFRNGQLANWFEIGRPRGL